MLSCYGLIGGEHVHSGQWLLILALFWTSSGASSESPSLSDVADEVEEEEDDDEEFLSLDCFACGLESSSPLDVKG
jgi:hypothetical protein